MATVSSSRKRSKIWDYFRESEKAGEAICKVCSKRFKTPTGTTTVLNLHLQSAHPLQLQELKAKKIAQGNKVSKEKSAERQNPLSLQQTLKQSFQAQNCFERNNPRAKEITEKIAYMICTDLQPFSVVEDEGFRNLVHCLEKRYVIPSRTTFSRTIVPELYEKAVKKVASVLQNDCVKGIESITYTTDGWTPRANDSFISLTCHYLNNNFTFVNLVLANSQIAESHTALNLLAKLEYLQENWNIPKSIPVYVVSDNARNITAAIRQSSWSGLHCFAHTLQLAIYDAKSSTLGMNNICKIARAIVGHFKKSSSAKEKLLEIQKKCGLPNHKLIQDVPTRWNSEFYMLERLCELREAISIFLSCESDDSDTNQLTRSVENLSPAQWKLASGFVSALKPLKDATTALSGQLYPTLSMVIPVLFGIHSSLNTFIKNSQSGSGIVFARNLSAALHTRFPNMWKNENPVLLAMILNPCYKTILLNTAEKSNALTLLKEAIVKSRKILREENQNECVASSIAIQGPPSSPVPSTSTSNLPTSLWDAFEKLASSPEPCTPDDNQNETDIINEINAYFALKVIPRKDCPLSWWRSNYSRFPHVSSTAKHYLAIPATQVASERLFSAAGNTVTARREQLNTKRIEQLLFIHSNFKHKNFEY